MTDPLELILQQTGVKNSYFSPTSRYFGLEVKILESRDGEKKAYIKRRFIAQPELFQLLQEHSVNQGERLDNIAHEYLGDAEQFWRICDANTVMHPNELINKMGNKIKITMPAGITGINS